VSPGKLQSFEGLNKSGLENIFTLSELENYLDEDGSLNLDFDVSVYIETNGAARYLFTEDNTENMTGLTVDDNKFRSVIILNQIGTLLGDKDSSDVIISVTENENGNRKEFFCHSAILSGNISLVYRLNNSKLFTFN